MRNSNVEDFQKFLGITLETLLFYCDDDDTDVRTKSSESLNRVIKSLMETQSSRILIELYKEIKKNTSSRSLRAALSRFCDLCHLVRPSKRRAYFTNLLSCLVKIIQRTDDEQLQETLHSSLPKLLVVFAKYSTDQETSLFIRTLINNIRSKRASIRRFAASNILHVIETCNRPANFLSFLLKTLIQVTNTSRMSANQDDNINTIAGVYQTFKTILPFLSDNKHSQSLVFTDLEEEALLDDLTFLYEMTLDSIRTEVNQIVLVAALEALSQIMKTPPTMLIPVLLRKEGLQVSRIPNSASLRSVKSKELSFSLSVTNQSADLDDVEEVKISSHLHELPDDKTTALSSSASSDTSRHTESLSGSREDHLDQEEDDTVSEFGPCFDNDNLSSSLNSSSTLTSSKDVFTKSAMKLTYVDSEEAVFSSSPEPPSVASSPSIQLSSEAEPFSSVMLTMHNIGEASDATPSIEYCARLVCFRFLLNGTGVHTDVSVRVSVKSLAAGCVASMVKISPTILLLELFKNNESPQRLIDVIDLQNHSDPVLKSQVALIVSSFMESILSTSPSFNDFLVENCSSQSICKMPNMEDLVQIFVNILNTKDSHSISIKNVLMSLQTCLPMLLKSKDFVGQAISVLDSCLLFKNHSYWLIIVELLNLISRVDFKCVSYWESSQRKGFNEKKPCIQKQVTSFVMSCLSHDDHRIRAAASCSLQSLTENMFFSFPGLEGDAISCLGLEESAMFLSSYSSETLKQQSKSVKPQFPSSLLPTESFTFVKPFTKPFNSETPCHRPRQCYERNLRLVINLLEQSFRENLDVKTHSMGCIAALDNLSSVFLTTEFPQAWSSARDLDFCHLLTDLLTSSSNPIIFDLSSHRHLTSLLSKFVCGFGYDCLKKAVLSGTVLSEVEKNDFGILNRDLPQVIPLLEALLTHLFRLLYLTSCVVNEVTPQASGPSLPSSKSTSSALAVLTGGSFSPIRRAKNKDTKNEGSKRETSFLDSNMYRIYDILRSSFESYRLSSDFGKSKFIAFTENILNCLEQLLELTATHFTGRMTEILVEHLKALMPYCPKEVISVTQSMLKSLFGTNFAFLVIPDKKNQDSLSPVSSSMTMMGIYETCFSEPFARFSQTTRMSLAPQQVVIQEEWVHFANVLRKTADKRVMGLLEKNNTSGDSASLSSYIKLFEPIVIKALKIYTTSSQSTVQAEILHLVSCLLQVRVNYWLLDSDQVFLEFVLRQFLQIEGGFIDSPHALVNSIFNFLCLLSHERFGSKQVVSISKVLQMAENLITTDKTLALIAFRNVLLEVFFFRSGVKSDSIKDLEMQRETVMSGFLKLVVFKKESIPLLSVIINASRKDSDEKWKKTSRIIIDDLLLNLKKVASSSDTQELLLLFESVSPLVFRPVDVILKGVLTKNLDMNLILLKILVTQAKEDVILTRTAKLLCSSRLSEESFALLLLEMLADTTEKIRQSKMQDKSLVWKLCHLLLYMTHMLQSGSFRRVARAASLLLKNNDTGDNFNLLHVNDMMSHLSHRYPLLVLQWTNILLLLGLNEEQEGSSRLDFFSRLCGEDMQHQLLPSASLELVRRGTVILLCDFACESAVSNAEQMTWLIINHIHDIIYLSHEITIKDFINAIHRNPASSALFIQSINAKCFARNFKNASFTMKLMDCLRFIHPTQSGSLVVLLIEKIIVNPQLLGLVSLRMTAQQLCLERLDMIVKSENVQEMQSQLSPEDVGKLLNSLDRIRHKDIVDALETFLEEIGIEDVLPEKKTQNNLLPHNFFVHVSLSSCTHASHPETLVNLISKLKDADFDLIIPNLDLLALFLTKDGMNNRRETALIYSNDLLAKSLDDEQILQQLVDHPDFLKTYLSVEGTASSKTLLNIVAHFAKILTTSDKISSRVITSLKVIKAFCNSHHQPALLEKDNFVMLSSLVDAFFVFITTNYSSQKDDWSSTEETANLLLEPSFRSGRQTCKRLSRILSFVLHFQDDITRDYIKPIVLILCRIPDFNSYVMVPPIIWDKKLWSPNFIGDHKTICPTVPSEELRDTAILSQFIDRIHALGWISRIQFEELWMSLLGVISLLQQESMHEGNFDDCDISSISIIAIQGLVDLLTQTLLTPSPGNPVSSEYSNTSEEKIPFFIHTKHGQKLSTLKETISSLEEQPAKHSRSYVGHVPILTLRRVVIPVTPTSSSSSTSSSTTTSPSTSKNTTDIDLHSCVHFLFDLLNQLSCSKASSPPMLVSVIDAFVSLSDLFFERNQFDRLLETFFVMYRHAVIQEDEEQLQALTLGIMKCSAVLSPECSADKLVKCVENGLKSSFIVCRIKTLQGIKHYLIQCPQLMKAITPSLSEYLVKHLGDSSLPSSKNVHHVLLMWDISFLLIDKFVDDFAQSQFGHRIFALALEVISQTSMDSSFQVKKKVAENLEKLTLNEVFAIKDADQISKACLERLRSASPSDESYAFSLLLTILYVFGPSVAAEHVIIDDPLVSGSSSDDDILEAMEKIAVLFDRLKVCCPHEAKVISSALPSLLVDFFPTQDILNKVIGEFVSSQQLYPHLLANIVFAVFSFLRQESKGDIIQEWVMLSLSSFPQLEPLPLSIWSLTCFLICVSQDLWIQSV